MPDHSLLSILHISDFHYSSRKWREQEIVVDALVADLETLCVGHRRPDVVMFTGDLVNGAATDSHCDAYDRFISRVASATKCSEERIFIVPGNHDVSQAVVGANKKIHIEWREKSKDMGVINAMFDAGDFDEIATKKFEQYLELERYLSDSTVRYKNSFVTVYHIEALNIDIVISNTALLSTGGHKDFDRDDGKLIVPEYAMREAVKALTLGSFRIFATHHPFGVLSEEGARYLRGVVQLEADMHVFGHMHVPLTENITSYQGDLYSNQAGAIFTARKDAYIGYSLVCVDRSTKLYETRLRSYFERGAFDEARDIVEQGRFYSSQQARVFWRSIATPVDDQAFRRHLTSDCLRALENEPEQGSGERGAHCMFVPPPMICTFVQPTGGDDTKSTVETSVIFDELVGSDDNFIIYAAPEYGRTTILRELQYRLLSDAGTVRFPRLPIAVDFADIKHNASRLFALIKSRVVGPTQDFDLESLLKLGHACIMFDDVLFADQRRMEILREFVTQFPKIRYVFSSPKSSAAPYGAHVVPEMPIRFSFVELCVLRRREMRQLIAKFNGGGDVDAVLDRLQSEFQEINLPFTAANGSILMAIYEEQSGFRPINRSVLIEQFVDTTLRKGSVEQSQRETFDYANKTALLAHLAAWMAMNNDYLPAVEAVRDAMKGYVDRLGLNADLDALMAEFFGTRLFVRKSDKRLSFRYRAVLEYFIAMQMLNDAKFKTWVMLDERYLQFLNEIQYFAGKVRNDARLVEEIGGRFQQLVSALEESNGKVDLHQLAMLKLSREEGTIERLSEQLSGKPLSPEERDKELEAEIPRDAEERQEVFRPKMEDPSQRLLAALFLYSGIVKNMELIEDAEKRRHLAAVWQGWSIFLHLSLSVVTELARHRRVRINGVLYEFSAPIGMSDEELARIIALRLPTGISRLISATLGTEKLERQLVEPELDAAKQPLVYEFFRAALIADLRLSASPSALRVALERLRGSSYLLEAMIWKIADLRRMDMLLQNQFDAIANPLAGAIAKLKGGSNMDEEKRKQLRRLQREGILLKLSRRNEPD